MRVIVCGSRNWEGFWAEYRIGEVMAGVEELAVVLGSPLQIVHGGCPTGADAIVDRWAWRRDHEVHIFEAHWDKYGKAAGPLRNSNMAYGGGDLCIGFLRDNSRGTIDMTAKAKAAKIPTFIIPWDEGANGPE
jgi:hypothetical protein